MCATVRAGAVALCLLFAQAAVGQQEKKEPVPEPAALKDAEKLVRDLFKDEYTKKSPSDRQALSRKLLAQSADVKDQPATRYVLLRESADLAGEAGDPTTGFKAIDEMAKSFRVEAARLKHGVLTSATKAAKTPEEAVLLGASFLKLSDEAAMSDDFDTAAKSLESGSALAKRAKDLALSNRIQAKGKEITEIKAKFEKARKAHETLRTNPDDPEANLVVGRYECLTKGNWSVGLSLLAKGSDAALRDLAAKDLSDPAEPPQQALIGDGWWDLGEKETSAAKENLKQRALLWYARSVPKLTGLPKTKVEKRVSMLQMEKLNRGTWVDLNDPKLFGKSGKAGDPIEMTGPLALSPSKFPAGEFDGLSVRLRLKPGQAGTGIVAFEPKRCGAWVDNVARQFVVCRLKGTQWEGEYTAAVPVEEQYLITILISDGEYVVYLNGAERHRMKTTITALTALDLEVPKGTVTFDQLRLRKRE